MPNELFLYDEIGPARWGLVDAKMVTDALAEFGPEADVTLRINSPGGSTTAGLAIYDTMQYVKPDVATIALGQAASMGAVLLAGGAEGKRFALPHSRVLLHQPLMAGLQGQAADIDIHAKDIVRVRQRLDQILAKHTGREARPSTKEVAQ